VARLKLVLLLKAPRLQSFVDVAASPAVAGILRLDGTKDQTHILGNEMRWPPFPSPCPKITRCLFNVVVFARLEAVPAWWLTTKPGQSLITSTKALDVTPELGSSTRSR
jgi:hypothetical protein